MREETRTIIFATVICVSCSLLLSGTAALLKSRQDTNAAFDVQRNIVKAFGLDITGATPDSIGKVFDEHISEGKTEDGLPIYVWKDDGKATKYAFPVSGKGLWSTIYGYLALDADLRTVAGISFYKHGETPGLGAEIEKDWFLDQFKGKELYDEDGTPLSFAVVKGDADKLPPEQRKCAVDGISGATLTGKGVQNFLCRDITQYANYFKNLREK